jgi:uncharacterized protein
LKLDPYREVAIVHAPGIGNGDDDARSIQDAIITHCERDGFRFAVLDVARGQNSTENPPLSPRNFEDSQYAAIYYPWIYTAHPRTGVKTLIPPGARPAGSMR